MGTSGAFGGSDTKPWTKVREQLDELLDPPERKPDPDDDDSDDGEPEPLDVLITNIAQALIADDPRVRPGRQIRNPTPSAAVMEMLGRLGMGDSARRTSSRGTTGRRDLGGGARSAGRAIYAGIAAGRGDAAAVTAAGVPFENLAGKSWFEQVLVITDTVIGTSANADEHALRTAVVEALLAIDADAAADLNEAEVLRDVIAAYVVELAVVELSAALTAREITEAEAEAVEDDVRAYVEVRRDAIAVSPDAVHTVTDFEDAAELLLQEVLLILRAGGASS